MASTMVLWVVLGAPATVAAVPLRSHIRASSTRTWRTSCWDLTGKRGASAPLSDLHEKIFKAWAERLLPLSEQELETQRRDFVPGGELDHRYRKALETAAAASVLEDLEGSLVRRSLDSGSRC